MEPSEQHKSFRSRCLIPMMQRRVPDRPGVIVAVFTCCPPLFLVSLSHGLTAGAQWARMSHLIRSCIRLSAQTNGIGAISATNLS